MTDPSFASQQLIGHDEALRQATDAYASGKMHHAWLMTGIEGIGKMTLARHLACHVLANGKGKLGVIDAADPVARLVVAETHPDLLTCRRSADEKTGELHKAITVDDALKVGAFFRRTATHGGWRVVIVE
jgi:DNA polymerase-3 subunit delta'